MTIFNRNSRTDDDSTNQTFLSSPSTPDYLAGIQNSNSSSLNDIASGDTSSLTMKGMISSHRNPLNINDKSNGNDSLARAKQPILTAIDAAHAVSPNATNSDKLVLFSSNSNGDNYNNTLTHNKDKHNHTTTNFLNKNQQAYGQQSQLSNHLLSSSVGINSGNSALNNNNNSSSSIGGGAMTLPKQSNDTLNHHEHQNNRATNSPFTSLPLSARTDPIMMAASQAINATQNMTPGRRTSSWKASYAAVNSGRLQTVPNQVSLDQGGTIGPGEVYCKCRSNIQGADMIACDYKGCKIEWFHYECVGITTPPAGNWYCDECRILLGIGPQKALAGDIN